MESIQSDSSYHSVSLDQHHGVSENPQDDQELRQQYNRDLDNEPLLNNYQYQQSQASSSTIEVLSYEECLRKSQGIVMKYSKTKKNEESKTPGNDNQSESAQTVSTESYKQTDTGREQTFMTRSVFQKFLCVVCCLCANTSNLIVLGLPFYKSEPHHFTCKGLNGKWAACTKDYICVNNLGKGEYLADTDDSQYINNWVEQVDMLCESKSRIGFMGACFFAGVISASSLLPVGYLADLYGRKWVLVGTMISEIASCYILLVATSLNGLYIGLYIMGLGHPGRFVVAINYVDEFFTARQKNFLLPFNQFLQGLMLIICAFYFQNMSRSVEWLQWGNLAFITGATAIIVVMFPESPKYLYSNGKYHEAREALALVARYNGQRNFNKQNIVFDTEKVKLDREAEALYHNADEEAQSTDPKDVTRALSYPISSWQFGINLIMMCGMFTMFSFSFWLIDFQQEYLGTDMYINFYIAGAVSIISGNFNLILFPMYGLRSLVQMVEIVMITSCLWIIMVQKKYISYEDAENELLLVNISIPLALIFLSLSCQVGYTATIQAAYQDERIFPFAQKSTATNAIILVSKFFTIGVSFVNEMPEPYPIGVIVCISFIAVAITFGFPTKDALEQMTVDLRAAQKQLRKQHQLDQENKTSSGVAIQGAQIGKDGKLQVPKEDLQQDQLTQKSDALE